MSDTLINAAGIFISFCFAAFSLRSETKTRRISNLLSLTQSHRELWMALIQRPELKRILERAVNLSTDPVTLEEQIQVGMIILHLSSAFEAMKNGLVIKPEALHEDVKRFFALPIPKAVWETVKFLQNRDFRAFVDSSE